MATLGSMTDDDVKLQVLHNVCAAFDRHDLDTIMENFVDECVFEWPRGPDPYGNRVVGREAVRQAFVDRFAGIPDVHYTMDTHFVSGDRGVSEWLLSGTASSGDPIEVRGCDIWTFEGNLIRIKNTFWKIRTT